MPCQNIYPAVIITREVTEVVCFIYQQRETETEDPSEQNGDQKSDEDAAAAADKEPANPRRDFNGNLLKLVKGLVRHLNPDKAVDDMLRDFFGGRLPPYEKKEAKKGNN